MLQHAVYSKINISFIPFLVPIWRVTVTLGQHILKRRWYYTHELGLVILAGDLVYALKL